MTGGVSRRAVVAVLAGIAIGMLAACGDGDSANDRQAAVRLAPLAHLGPDVQHAPVAVRDAYRFALANPSILAEVPCFCGCGAMGHTSNAACYLDPDSREGAPVFDHHALGCSICVDITQDVMRLMRQGKPLDEIRAYVDTTYGRYGPSNIPGTPGGGS